MVKHNYNNLSIESKRYHNIRRKWDQSSDTELSFSGYTIQILENSVEREVLLKKMYPHLKVAKVTEKQMIIENTKTEDYIKVYRSGNKIESSVKDDDYISYAMIHPEFPV